MRKNLKFSAFFLVFISVKIVAQPGANWDLVFEDNFNGNTLDQKKWSYNYPWGKTHNHRAYMADSMVTVSNGQLQIKAINKRHPAAPAGTDQYNSSFGYLSFDYTSGAIHSKGKFEYTYGYMEGRFKVPPQLFTWPAFWTLNADGAWPPEIDVLEIPADRKVHHYYYHYGPDYKTEKSFGATHTGPDKSQDFHTYGVEWGPDYMKFYFDGKVVNSYTGRPDAAQGKNMYILINLAIGAWAANPTADAVWPAYYLCDYVKVWKKSSDINGGFESTSLSPWTIWNNAKLDSQCKRSGNNGVLLTGNPVSIEQQVILDPGTRYVFGGYGKVNTAGESILIGVKNYGGSQLVKTISSTDFKKDSVVFITGINNSSATLFYYKDKGTGSACGDDFFLYKLKDCNGTEGGTSYFDACKTCVGGKSELYPCVLDLSTVNRIKSVNSGLCVESGEQTIQNDCNNGIRQLWKFISDGKYYSIMNTETGKYLSYQSATGGANLITGEKKTIWRIENAGNDQYFLIPSENLSFAADVANESTKAGEKIILWNRTTKNNQKFTFEPAVITNIEEDKNARFSYYPNPFTDFITIAASENFRFVISDLSGKVIDTGESENPEIAIGRNLEKGFYQVKITGSLTSEVFTIEKK